MKFLIGLAATAMSALLLTPTLAPTETDPTTHSRAVAEATSGIEAVRA